MSGDIPFIDIILFALVAAFLILRLRSVLGRRDGHEVRGNDPFKPAPSEPRDENVVRLPDRSDAPSESLDVPDTTPPPQPGVEGGVAQIETADPSFDANEFLSGARIAFEMVLNAYAAGDTSTLQPLLSPDVFGNFEHSIRDREQANETLEINLIGMRSVEIVEAYMAGRTAHLIVKFVSEQSTVTRDENGEVVDGDPATTIEVSDFWTFARDTRSGDPNWMLVATGALE